MNAPAAALVLALLWAMVLRPLAIEWDVNPQYSYAWSVPFLALFLLVREWRSRPSPRLTSSGGAVIVGVVLLCFFLLPLRVIAEANPDWRLTSWLMALSVAAIGLLLANYMGGRPWLRHFGLVLCLPLLAVPWPVRFEQALVQRLMRVVASITVEIVNAFDVAAVREGNLIRIANGVVGVDEACSGIRSLQATLLIAIALGQLFRMTLSRRLALIALGALIAFVTNVARTTILVFVGATHGLPAIREWHDPAGFTITATCLFALLVCAVFLSRKQSPPWEGDAARGRGLPLLALGAIAVWVFAMEATTELWYRTHERQLITRTAWRAAWPESAAPLDIPEATRAMLRFNDAASGTWQNPPGVRWWTFFARWEPGRAALQLVRSHSPDICLPAIGRTFVREHEEPIAVQSNAGELPFRVYEFQQEGKPLFVFVCIQEDKFAPNETEMLAQEWSAMGRLRAAWNGRRNLGQRLLEIAILGYDDFPHARDALAAAARDIVKPTG